MKSDSEMKAGRELDALVAEKVFGISKQEIADAFSEGSGTLYSKVRVRPYSTDIAAAWEVFEALRELNNQVCIQGPTDWNPRWKVFSSVSDEADDLAEAETAPHAICLAALLMKGIKV